MDTSGTTVTIKSIAEALGVSFSTVAKALRDDPKISPQTRRLVQAKAEEMHYNRNYFAQSLRRNASKTVAIVVNDLDIQAYGEMISAISGQLAARGYTTLISDSLYSEEFERTSIQNVLTRRPEAVIVAPIDPEGDNLRLLEPLFPVTLVLAQLPDALAVSSVRIDHRLAGALSAGRMLKRGERNLIFVGPENYQSGSLFLSGVAQAYTEAGLRIPEEDVFRFKPDQQTACRLFRRQWEASGGGYTGAICFCDSMALGVYQAARELGLRIPEDIGVIGYDDGPVNEFIDPPLTSVRLPRDQMAAACSQFVIDRLIGGDTALRSVCLPPTLSERGSV